MDGQQFDSELDEDIGFIRYISEESCNDELSVADELTKDLGGSPSLESNEGKKVLKGGEEAGGEGKKYDAIKNGNCEDDSDPETDLEDELDELSRAPNTVRMLRLEDVYLQSCKELKITPCSPFLRQIRDDEIDISHYNIGPMGAKALAETLKINTTTTLLNVHDNGIDTEGAKALADMLKENCFITVLDLSMNFVKEEGLAAVCKMLGMNRYLLELSLASTKLSDASALIIADAMTRNSTLRSLNLSSNEIGTEGGIHLAHGISANTGITFLDLSSNHIRGKGAIAIAESLLSNHTLKTLDISANGFSDYGTRAVGRALKTNSTLREVDISQNRISPDGAWALGIGLEENIGLKVLKIGGNPFQSRGATSIIDSLITNKESTIEEIYLDDIIVSSEFERLLPELLEQRPGLHVQFGVVVRGKEHRRRGKEQKDLVSRILDYIELRGIRVVDFFRAMDKTGRLSITKDELIKGLKTAGIPMRMSQLENLFELLDLDGNGFAQYKEFVDIIKRRTHEEFATLRNNYQWNH